MLKILLLFSIFFNTMHLSYLSLDHQESCKHTQENHSFTQLTIENDKCGDLCHMHHLCCFHAIMPFNSIVFEDIVHYPKITAKKIYYSSTFQKTLTKPPIS